MDYLFNRLSKSKFRSSFHLKEKDIKYINVKGMDEIIDHAYTFIDKRLSVLNDNDGKQTPTKGHPVFIAQHATATCCRGCIEKWHNIKKEKVLTEDGLRNIEDIKLGDKVYSLNTDTNERELKEVTRLIRSVTSEVYEITIGDEVVKTTPRHEFYVVDKGWIRAYELEEGDVLVSTSNENMEIKNIEHIYLDDAVSTYNLTVDDNHNYLITEYRVLVHNASSPT